MAALRLSALLLLALGVAMPVSAQALFSDAPRPLVYADASTSPRTARPPVELVTDGSFEGGSPNSAWSSTSAQTPPVSPFCTVQCGGAPRTGDGFAFLAGLGNGVSESASVSQTVTIPADATSALLTFYVQLGHSGDATGEFAMFLDSTPLVTFTQADAASFSDYTAQNVDLSFFADGQPHTLRFVAVEVAGTEQGAFFAALVDDVSLIAEVPSTSEDGPVNDFLFAAAPIAAPDTFVTVSSVGADAEDGDFNPSASCVSTGSDGNNALWWAFLATAAGSVEAFALGVGADPVDTIVSVLTLGEDGALTEVACNDDQTPGSPDDGSRATFDVTPGTRYFVRVTGFNGEEGDLFVRVGGLSGLVNTYVTGAHNDNLGLAPGALQFSRAPASYPDTNVGATEETTGEPLASCAGDGEDGRNSVWRVFISPSNASVTLDLAGSTFDTILSVYRAEGGSLVEEVACNDDAGDVLLTSRVMFDATANTLYAVRTVGFEGASGAILYGLDVAPATAAESGTGATASRLAVAPNPIASSAQVSLTVGTAQTVRVGLYDLLGREVKVLHDAPVVAGQPTDIQLQTAGLAPGVYVVRASGPELHLAERVTVLR
ncbi:MAG: hypothetical protein Rubg2KO_25680 [Rubricoccaceae bacterium]